MKWIKFTPRIFAIVLVLLWAAELSWLNREAGGVVDYVTGSTVVMLPAWYAALIQMINGHAVGIALAVALAFALDQRTGGKKDG